MLRGILVNDGEESERADARFPRAGTPLDHGNVNRQQFKKLLRKADLPPMCPYDIRHSFATLWVESGESAEVLQMVLGQSPSVREA